jgi:hypothetical protein
MANTTTVGAIAPDYSATGLSCTSCSEFQVSVSSGAGSVVPYDGTVTAFHMKVGPATGSTENMTPYVVRNLGGGNYEMVGVTTTTSIKSAAAHSVATIPAAISVKAGDIIGLFWTSTNVEGTFSPPSGGVTDKELAWQGSLTAGTTYSPNPTGYTGERVNLSADLSYTPPPPPATADTTPPVISLLKTSYPSFRVSTKGAVVSKHVHAGTTFSYTSSEAANVTYTVSRLVTSKKKKTTIKTIESFTRPAIAGANKLAYSGRYRNAKGKKLSLSAGSYRLSVVAVDSSGNVSLPATKSFKIVN